MINHKNIKNNDNQHNINKDINTHNNDDIINNDDINNDDINNDDINNDDINNDDFGNEEFDNDDFDNDDFDNDDFDDEDFDEEYNENLKEYTHSNLNSFDLNEGLFNYSNYIRILDPSLKISTITITCNMKMSFNIENIGLYFNEFDNVLFALHYNKKIITSTDITDLKIKKNKKKIVKKVVKKGNFLNQISFYFDTAQLMNSNDDEVILTTNKKKKKINMKLFRNGSIQCTGLGNDIYIVKKCFEILFQKFKKRKAIYKNNKFEEIYFVDDISMLSYSNIKNFNIRMINTNFLINYNIKRENLQKLLVEQNIYVDYDPNDSVSVNIRYKLKNKKEISIKVFESGSISITGANLCDEISEAYFFINNFIFKNSKEVLIKPIDAKKIIILMKNKILS